MPEQLSPESRKVYEEVMLKHEENRNTIRNDFLFF
jgi:hypothetical protein